MFSLNQILTYDKVWVQCHDNPDSDALGSAYALSEFLSEKNKACSIIYSGFGEISKANLLLFCEKLNIQAEYIQKDADVSALIGENDLLLLVDCQYRGGNVKVIPAKTVAVIDHHTIMTELPEINDVRPYLGSCSTLVWKLLKDTGFDISAHTDIATALYYGLYTDTNSFSEINHPLDLDMRDNLKFDRGLIKLLKNSNLSLMDLKIAAAALENYTIDNERKCAVFESAPCDSNILGFTADLGRQVNDIDLCIVYCILDDGVKFSVRSDVREIMANEFAARMCEGVGTGGGHNEKAGGFIEMDAIASSGLNAKQFIKQRIEEYFNMYDLVYAEDMIFDVTRFTKYRKLPQNVGFVPTTELFPEGTEIFLRTLEGDTSVISSENIYIMVGLGLEIYPIKKNIFETRYEVINEKYVPDRRFVDDISYTPTVKGGADRNSVSLIPFTHLCVSGEEALIWGREISKSTKVFNSWNSDGYMLGEAGDILAVRADDYKDVYIIRRDIFDLTYEKTED